MTWETFLDVLLDVAKDSAITFAAVLLISIIVSFFEDKLSKTVSTKNKLSPLIGASIGLIPQCGFSIVASDMYRKRSITMGTLVAVFIACSDEAIPIMIQNVSTNPKATLMILPLIGIKLVLGFIVGFFLDLFFGKKIAEVQKKAIEIRASRPQKIQFVGEANKSCCAPSVPLIAKKEDTKVKKHLVRPLLASLKILAYVVGINFVLSMIIALIGEDNLSAFLNASKWVSPIFSTMIGYIPNCASSIVITQLYVDGSISFGAALSGLIVNAGIGLLFMFKDRKKWRESLIIFGVLTFVALLAGYVAIIIETLI